MDNLFRTRVLTEAVNKIKPVTTTILDRIFSRKQFQISDRLAWDIISGNETLLKNLKVNQPSQISTGVNGANRPTVICTAPRFSDKRIITASDLNALRAFGQQFSPELLGTRISQELSDMRGKFDRTREYMAAKALSGQILDSDGTTVLVDYGFAGAQTPTLTTKDLWTDSESKPINKIRAWKKIISQACGIVDRFVAFCGTEAMDALLENQSVRELMKYTAGDQIAQTGRIVTLGGVEIIEYFGSYLDSSNVRQDFIPAKYFVLVGEVVGMAAELYAPVVDFKDGNGVGSGNPASMFFSKSWEEEDPSARIIKVEGRPLPVLYKPEAIVYAKVVA